MTPKHLGRRTAGWKRRAAMIAAALTAAVAMPAVSTPADAATLPAAPVITFATAGPAPGAVSLTWTRPSNGGWSITTFGFSVSVNGGTTWSGVHSFSSTRLSQSTASFPPLVCTSTTPGSRGCLFRIHAANALGFGLGSKPFALWTVPGAPVHVAAGVTLDFSTVILQWRPSTVTGGLAITGFDVLGAMDGAVSQVLTTVHGATATVPCTARRTCSYSIRATNIQGNSPASAPVTVTPAPGPVQGATLHKRSSDVASGRSILDLGWTRPLTGLPVDHYDVEICGLPVGVPTWCDPTSAAWIGLIPVSPEDGVLLTASSTCQAGFATCLMRVRGVNARGGAGAWRAIDLEPWAPYGVTIAPGSTRGMVVVRFSGPAESGPAGTAAKHYRVLLCDLSCGSDANWHTVSDAVPYPPAGRAPFVAGTFSCRPPAHVTAAAVSAHRCWGRMQFVDGLGNVSILSATAIGVEHS